MKSARSASETCARIASKSARDRKPSRVPAHADLGGWSGGPVFRIVEQETVTRLEIAGVIYEYTSGYEIVLAHPLSCIAADGTFLE
jgi:hypothetical protein